LYVLTEVYSAAGSELASSVDPTVLSVTQVAYCTSLGITIESLTKINNLIVRK